MAQNITTLLQKEDAEALSVNDLLYLVQGSGSTRDRKLALGVLLAWIQSEIDHGVFEEIEIRGGSTYPSVRITKDGMVVANSQNSATVEIGPNSVAVANGANIGSSLGLGKIVIKGLNTGGASPTFKTYEMVVGSGDNANRILFKDGGSLANLMAATFIGNLQGNVTGNVSGNVTGNLQGDVRTPKLRRTYSEAATTYSITQLPALATNVKQSVTGPTIFILKDDVAAEQANMTFVLNHAPAEDTELVIDFQSDNNRPLLVCNGTSIDPQKFCNQAPNTVRRYRYSGSAWECLY